MYSVEVFMKGNPLLRFLLVLALLLAVLVPVFKVTNPGPQTDSTYHPVALETATVPRRVTLLLRAAPSPFTCAISQRGKVLLNETNLRTPGEYNAAAELYPGEDLLVTATWHDDGQHAVAAEVLIEGVPVTIKQTYWAGRSLEDTLPLPGSLQ